LNLRHIAQSGTTLYEVVPDCIIFLAYIQHNRDVSLGSELDTLNTEPVYGAHHIRSTQPVSVIPLADARQNWRQLELDQVPLEKRILH
jgi:hypothetical protein